MKAIYKECVEQASQELMAAINRIVNSTITVREMSEDIFKCRPLLLLCIIILTGPLVVAQEGSQNVKLYSAWVRTINPEQKIKGHIYEFVQDEITLVKKKDFQKGKQYELNELLRIPIDNLDAISFRRKGSIWKNTLLGAGVGTVIGAFIGAGVYASDDWFSAGTYIAFFGTTFGILGSGIGSIAGAVKDKSRINGNKQIYEKVKSDKKSRSVKYYYD